MRTVYKNKIVLCVFLGTVVVLASLAWSHCQVPCGIYDDEARFKAIGEHITTIEKGMKQIEELSAQSRPNMNQIVRWVNNKEEHADELAHIVTYYFMAQRVKLPAKDDVEANKEYVQKLTLLHHMLVYSMKAKQTTDIANAENLKSTLAKFHDAYFGEGH